MLVPLKNVQAIDCNVPVKSLHQLPSVIDELIASQFHNLPVSRKQDPQLKKQSAHAFESHLMLALLQASPKAADANDIACKFVMAALMNGIAIADKDCG
jgi:hypothetical protein